MEAEQQASAVKKSPKMPVKGFVYYAVGIAALGGLLFGYDTGVISGAILYITKQFSLSSTMEEIVVSAVLVGAVVGASVGGALTDRFGRRGLIIAAGAIFIASSLGTALSPSVPLLISARVISGIAIGLASFISPMYIAELVPARVRGALVAVNMLAITTGIVAAYLTDYALTGNGGWRWMFGLGVVPAVGLTIGMWFLPDSPRWLISKSKIDEARDALKRLRSPEEIGPAVADIQQSTAKTSGDWKTELFQPSLRMPLIIGIGLALFQQLSGINTVIYYAPTIFKYAGFQSAGASILAAVGLGVVMLCCHVAAIFLLDRVGRRPLLLVGVAGQIIGLATLGAAFHFKQLSSSVGDMAVASLVVYVACFAFGLGPIFWLLISEIYPLAVRGAAMSAATVANWGMNLAVVVTFLTLVDKVGHSITFWIYGAITVGAWVFIYRLVPETKGKTLEQIEAHWRTSRNPARVGRSQNARNADSMVFTTSAERTDGG
jgi:sugar porter (SP) family MFS transporter